MSAISPSDLDGVLALFQDAAIQAADIALGYFTPGGRTSAGIEYKDGGSPVTEADFAVDAYLKQRLCAAIPDAAWLSEETVDSVDRLGRTHVLVVDPIDGTRGFLSGDPRWCVCIALVTRGRPTVGVVQAPVLDQSFSSILGRGAFCNGVGIHASARQTLDDAVVAGPANIAKHFFRPPPIRVVPKIPSLAIRMVHVAAGFLDGCVAGAYPHDWDIAAADLILHEAGALLTDRHGTAPLYNQPSPRHPTLVAASPVLHRALLDYMYRPSD